MSELEQVTHADGTTTTTVPAALTRDRARAVFGQTMGLVALTAGMAALGAYVGRDLSWGWGLACMIGAIACIFGLNVAIRRSEQLAIGLLFGMGALLGAAVGPMLAYYADVNPQALWQAAGATALFIAGFGAYGYATRRDLSLLGRISFFALLGLIVFGLVMVFVSIPGRRRHLRGAGARDLRRLHDVRLPAPPAHERRAGGAAARRLDLPRRLQRLPAPPVAARRRRSD